MRRVQPVTILAACILLVQALMLTVLTHETLRAEQKKIILQHADTIEGGEAEAGPYRSVQGNVVFLHDNYTLKCDRATDFGEEKKIVLSGNVYITDGAVEIYSESGVYYPSREVGELSGNVKGRMLNNSLSAKAHKAVINKAASQIWLYEDAIAWHEGKQMSGDIILLHLTEAKGGGKQRRIDELQVHGKAFFAARDSLSASPVVYDQFSGKKMVVLLNDRSKISAITLTGLAESLYHLYDEHREPAGINYSSGDVIRMIFTDGVLKKVKVTGNVEGKQYPERYRTDKSINLSGFAWRESENPFRTEKSLP